MVRYYEEVNLILGDIVKVTPSSKVVGDLAMFLLTKGVDPTDLVNLPPGESFPESVVDMLSGGLGQPTGGWPKDVQKVILGDLKANRGRPGARAEKIDLKETRKEVAKTTETKRREKADSTNEKQVGAPIPAMVSSLQITVGHQVEKGDKLAILEAMKMQTTVYAQCDGIVDRIPVQVGDQVEAKDLLVELR